MTKVTICGCGNSAQLMAALITKGGVATLSVYAPFQDEASRLQQAIETSPEDGIHVMGPEDDMSFFAKLDPSCVTKDAKTAIHDADLILLPLPAFAIGPTLRDIGPHLKSGAYVGMLPGQGGGQWAAANVLGKDFYREKNIVLFAAHKLPYNVRVLEYGKRIRVFSYKRAGIGSIPSYKANDVVDLLVKCVPYMEAVKLPHFLNTTLNTGNQCIHPARFYSLAHASEPYDRNPMFYDEMDEADANRIQRVSDEIGLIKKGIKEMLPHVDLSEVLDIREDLIDAYGEEIEDKSSLLTVFTTNKGFRGISSPMVEAEDGVWKVDWKSRYVADDIPYGLCVLRGLAELVNVETPTIDHLILWAQKHMKKAYLVDGKLCGSDVKDTGAPQAFGYTSLLELPEAEEPDVETK